MEVSKELLVMQNFWWSGRSLKFDPVLRIYQQSPLRFRNKELNNLVFKKDLIYLFEGGRAIGKTTFSKLLIRHLIDREGVVPKNILYYSCNNILTFEQLNEVIKLFLQTDEKKRLYLIIDEISLVRGWDFGIKSLQRAGKLKNVTLFLFNAVQDKNLKINLVKKEFRPLNFLEFVNLFNPGLVEKITKENFKELGYKLDYYLDIYFLTGGYLNNINSFKKKTVVDQAAYDNFLAFTNLDIARQGRDINLARQILEEIVAHTGEPIGYKTIAKNTKAKTHITIVEYLELFEKIFLTSTLFQEKAGKDISRRAKKVFFADPFIFWAIYGYIRGATDSWRLATEHLHSKKVFCALVKTIIFAFLIKKGSKVFYFRDNTRNVEIDFLVKKDRGVQPILVRYNREVSEADYNIFKRAKFKNGIIITNNQLDLKGDIKLIPLTYFLIFE